MNAIWAKILFLDKSEVIRRYEKRVGHRAAVYGWLRQVVMIPLMFWSSVAVFLFSISGWAITGNAFYALLGICVWWFGFVLVLLSLRVFYESRFYREASQALGFKVTRKDPLITGGVAYEHWCDERGLVPWGFGQEPSPPGPHPDEWPGWQDGSSDGPSPRD